MIILPRNNLFLSVFSWTVLVTLSLYTDSDLRAYSFIVNESTISQSLNNDNFTFLVILNNLGSHEKFKECLLLFKQLSKLKNLTLLHTDFRSHDGLLRYFNISTSGAPLYLLFYPRSYKPIVYRGSWKSNDISRWLVNLTGLEFLLPGCISSFNKIAQKFRSCNSIDEKHELLLHLKSLSSSKTYRNSKYAKYYVHVAQRILESHSNFLSEEILRIKRIIDGEIADHQKSDFKKKLNILTQFGQSRYDVIMKTEL